MRVFVTGATGFIGRALVARLLRDGHEVSAWVRSPAKAEGVLEAQVRRVPTRDEEALRSAVASADAVVHPRGCASRREALDRILQTDPPAQPPADHHADHRRDPRVRR